MRTTHFSPYDSKTHSLVNSCEAAPDVHLVNIWHSCADLLEGSVAGLALASNKDAGSIHSPVGPALQSLIVLGLSTVLMVAGFAGNAVAAHASRQQSADTAIKAGT